MKYTVSGSGQALIEPFLDNMVAYKNTDKKPATERSCCCSTVICMAGFSSGLSLFSMLSLHRGTQRMQL